MTAQCQSQANVYRHKMSRDGENGSHTASDSRLNHGIEQKCRHQTDTPCIEIKRNAWLSHDVIRHLDD